MEGHVYFVQIEGMEDGPIKIGHTTRDVEVRLGELRRQMPFHSLTLLGAIPADREHEAFLKKVFRDQMIAVGSQRDSEWFMPAKRLLDYIGRVLGAAPA